MRTRNNKASRGKQPPRRQQSSAESDSLKAELVTARRRIRELERRVDEDPLLPILNRRGFVRELERTLAFARRYGIKASLIYLDLDDFKIINDTHGHAIGDVVLARVAGLLLNNVRGSDVIGRLGGDEFALVLWNTEGAPAEAKAAALAKMIAEETFAEAEGDVRLTVSHGVTALSGNDTAETALARADKAMYERKGASRQG